MALLFADSFDHYSTAQIDRKWVIVAAGSFGTPLIGAVGRNSTSGMTIGGGAGIVAQNISSTDATVIIGAACKWAVNTVANTFFIIRDSSTTHASLTINTDGSLTVAWQGGGSFTTAGGIVPLYTAQFNYIEFKVVIHDSTGTLTVKVNGTTVISQTGKDTKGTANAYATNVQVNAASGNSTQQITIDDFYLCDSTGSAATDFLGDVRVEYRGPSGAGATTNMTPSAGSNYQCVDDNPANDETDYVSSSTPGHKDTYAIDNLVSTAGAVVAVAVVTVDRKDDAGARTHSHRVRLSGTELAGTAFSPTTSYVIHQSIFHTKPGGGAWTISDVNSAEAGAELTT